MMFNKMVRSIKNLIVKFLNTKFLNIKILNIILDNKKAAIPAITGS